MADNGEMYIDEYDRVIKRLGLLSRCEERVLFEKIVNMQNLIIHDTINDTTSFNELKAILLKTVKSDEFIDVFNFDSSIADDCDAEDIINSYIGMIYSYVEAETPNDIDRTNILLTFSNEIFEQYVKTLNGDVISKYHVEDKLELIDYYRQRVYEYNIALVIDIAMGYVAGRTSGTLTTDDLIQEGMVGLKRAIKKHNPHMGTKFSTMAYAWISQEIAREIDNKGRIIAIPCNVLTNYRKSVKAVAKLQSSLGVLMSLEEMVEATKDDSFKYVEAPLTSIDAPQYTAGYSLHEVVADYSNLVSDRQMIVNEFRTKVREAMANLTEVEKKLIDGLFGYDTQAMNNKAIMEQLGLNSYNYTKVKNSAMNKIKDVIENDPYFNNWQTEMEDL